MRKDWIECEYQDLLDYEQPTNYIVRSTNYNDAYKTPVLTAGKSFIKGYTEEKDGIFNNLPVIIFDDFTTATKYVNFEFKVKSSAMKILKPTCDLINMKLAYFYFQIDNVQNETHKRCSISIYSKKKFPLPPLPEQKAIVSKIEQLFSDLDNGVANLKKAQEQLKTYRQAVLKKAFEGELTKEWREAQTDLPGADELLEQIKIEREKYYKKQSDDWKESVKKWEADGKDGRKPTKPKKQKELPPLTAEELKELPVLPDGWKWRKFGNNADKIFDGTHFSPKSFSEGEYKYITAKNIKEGKLDFSNLTFVDRLTHKQIYSRCDVKKNDILYIKDGATTGKAVVNHLNEEFSLLSSVGVFRFNNSLFSSKFIEYFLNSQITRNRMLKNIAGVAITRLTLIKLNNSKMIVCSLREQHQIVQEIESRLSVCENVEANIKEALKKSESLRQSILKKAFEGKLLTESELEEVRNDPEWEPAEKLLERIKAEKAEASKQKRKKR